MSAPSKHDATRLDIGILIMMPLAIVIILAIDTWLVLQMGPHP